VIKKKMGLTKRKKKPITKQTPPPPPQNKITQNPPSFSLFTFIVLLFVDVGVVVITIFLLCSRKWLLSYAPLCPQNLKSRFITNPHNGTVMELPSRSLFTEMELEPLFPFS
jgi:hypothetical protein